MSELRKEGDIYYLNLQLYDGVISMPKRVFVELTDASGTLLEPRFEIPHIVNGDFRENTKVMPNESIVSAQYFVYENDGTTPDITYTIPKDIYLKDLNGEVIHENLDAKVSSIGGSKNTIEVSGEILEIESISGTIEESEVSGSIEEIEAISGEVKDGC